MDILQSLSFDHTTVAVGHHRGIHEIREEDLEKEEKSILSQLSPRKKTEWLASRELLFSIADLPMRAQCLYDDFGKPFLVGIDRHISLSHSELYCAAMISDRPCGVDIQKYTDTVRRIADRFLTPEDLAMIGLLKNPFQGLHMYWGAKECIYKAYGKRKLGFREHIFLTYIDEESGVGSGEIRYEGLHLSYDIYFRMLPQVAWVFCVEHHDHPPDHGMREYPPGAGNQ